MRLILLVLLVASACRKPPPPPPAPPSPSLLGDELGLDHVGIAVSDLPAARTTFHKRLGFERPIPGRLPNGIDNVNFYFEDATYLETLTSNDAKKVPWLAWFLGRYQEGANFVVLSTSSAKGTAEFLGQRGFPMSAPTDGSIAIEGGRPGGSWQTLFFQESPLPGSPLYFIEYPKDARADFLRQLKDPEIRRRSFPHRNTAVGIKAVWLAVRDLPAATKAYTALGLAAAAAFDSAPLSARGQSITAGRGHLVLFAPREGGPVKAFLDRRGPGVLGLSIEVRSLDTAQKVISEGTGARYERYDGHFGPSFLILPAQAHGAYLELFQKRGP